MRRHPDELACDMAETYRIYDTGTLPARKLATLACGLREDSRVKRAMSGRKISVTEELLAGILDRLSTLVWFKTEDGYKGRNRPESVLAKLIGLEDGGGAETGFDTPEDFETARKRIVEGG